MLGLRLPPSKSLIGYKYRQSEIRQSTLLRQSINCQERCLDRYDTEKFKRECLENTENVIDNVKVLKIVFVSDNKYNNAWL